MHAASNSQHAISQLLDFDLTSVIKNTSLISCTPSDLFVLSIVFALLMQGWYADCLTLPVYRCVCRCI